MGLNAISGLALGLTPLLALLVPVPFLLCGARTDRMGSMRAAALPMDKMRAEAVDEYALVRDAWMQKRQHQIAEKP